jgi:hypothetical protein
MHSRANYDVKGGEQVMNRGKTGRPDKRHTSVYYYIRNLYFQAIVDKNSMVVHKYSSADMSNMARKEFNEKVAPSSIRRWIGLKDKDLDNRTWLQEWNRRLANGVVNAFRDGIPSKQAFPSLTIDKKQEDEGKTPMQRLSDLKQQTIEMTAISVYAIERFLHAYLAQMEQDFKASGYQWTDSLEARFHKVLPYLGTLKGTLLGELKDLKQMEKDIDPEIEYGRFVPLKDPQARERVRNAFAEFIKIAYDKQEAKKEEEGGNGDRKEHEEKVETVKNSD